MKSQGSHRSKIYSHTSLRSDSSIHSSNTWRTSASQSTTKRTHTTITNGNKAIISVKGKGVSLPRNRDTSENANEGSSTGKIKVQLQSKAKTTPKTRDSSPRTQRLQRSSINKNTNANSVKIATPREKVSAGRQQKNNKKVLPSPLNKRVNGGIRRPKSTGSADSKRKTTARTSLGTKGGISAPDTSSNRKGVIVNKTARRSNIITPKKTKSPSSTKRDDKNGQVKTNHPNSIKKSKDIGNHNYQRNSLIKSNNSNMSDKSMTKEKKVDETKDYISEYDLHLHLENGEWEKLYQQLQALSRNSAQILPEISATSEVDATVLHTACWKAPAELTIFIIKLLYTHQKEGDETESIYLTKDKDGNTPLHLLCANMMPFCNDLSSKPILDISVLESLITIVPAALIIQNEEGDTPLHLFVTSIAASASTFSSVPPSSDLIGKTGKALTLILDALPSGKDGIIMKDDSGATPFHSALSCPAEESILMSLLDYHPGVCKIGDANGLIPLHYVAAFLNTPSSVVDTMIEMYQYGVCHKTKNGDTPLHILVRNSADDVIFEIDDKIGKKKLLNRNAIEILEMLMGDTDDMSSMEDGKQLNEEYDPFFITNKESLTPIHCCALFNASVQVTQILMGHPSAQRAALVTNSFGAIPLHLAAAHSNVCVDIAIAVGTSESAVAQDGNKRTPLHVAAENKNATVDLIECIVDLNSQACEIVDEKGNLPLHVAVQSEAKKCIVEALLRYHPLAAKCKNSLLDTPLHSAAKHNASVDVVELLIDQFREAIKSPNQNGDLPLHHAASSQASPDVFETLLEAYPESATTQNKRGDCPLHYLAGHKTVSIVILRLYIDAAECSLSIMNKKGQKPLDKAKENNASDEVLELLQSLVEI